MTDHPPSPILDENALREARDTKSDARNECSCHPDDRPPVCQLQYGSTHCKLAFADAELTRLREENGRLAKEREELQQLFVGTNAEAKRFEVDRDSLRAQLAEAQAREPKVRWEGNTAYIGQYVVGNLTPVMNGWRAHLECSVDALGAAFTSIADARATLESAALSALCEGGK